jgi:hypothetical protein
MRTTDRSELSRLVHRFREVDGTEAELEIVLTSLKESLPHPRIMTLLWDDTLSDDEVVERAFAYEGIALGPSPGSSNRGER